MSSIVGRAAAMLAPGQWQPGGPISFQASAFFELPEELALRLLGRAIDGAGDEGPVELGKLEALLEALYCSRRPLPPHPGGRRCHSPGGSLTVERAPPRRSRAPKRP